MTRMLVTVAVAAITLFTTNSAEARDRHDHRSDRDWHSRHHHSIHRHFITRGYVDPHHSYAAPRYDRYGHRVDSHGHHVDRYGNHIRRSHHSHHCED